MSQGKYTLILNMTDRTFFSEKTNASLEEIAEFILDKLSDDAFDELRSRYCWNCGTKDLPCYCWDDS